MNDEEVIVITLPPDTSVTEFIRHLENTIIAEVGLPEECFDPSDMMSFAA